MIKLDRPPKPIQLTEEVQKQLTEKFKDDNSKSVWKQQYIVDELLNMSSQKCCYCETKLLEESKYLHIEHYHHKSKYPDEVVEWNNLLPSCERCNINKGTHDTVRKPIINPTIEDPKKYLFIKNYRYKSKKRNKLGLETISTLYLNDTKKLVKVRFDICNALSDKLLDIEVLLDSHKDQDTIHTRTKNRIVNGIKDILRYAQPTEEYSAFVSSTILNDDTYSNIKKILQDLDLWDNELEELENTAKKIMLDCDDC